jgi:hypothetical protein
MDVDRSAVLGAMVTAVVSISPYFVGVAAWCVLALLAIVIEIMARFGTRDLLTMGQVLRCVMRSTVGRWVIVLGWMWVGWHFFVR